MRNHRGNAQENDGIHIGEVIDEVECGEHNAPTGQPCWTTWDSTGMIKNRAICNNRVIYAGFNGKISVTNFTK